MSLGERELHAVVDQVDRVKVSLLTLIVRMDDFDKVSDEAPLSWTLWNDTGTPLSDVYSVVCSYENVLRKLGDKWYGDLSE